MRCVEFPPLSRSVSAIGFGCASLGSRVGARHGIAALERAYEAGVRWFDVAPSYGDGQAEALLGKFLSGKRSEVVVCSKVGILPRPLSPAKRIAKHVIQSAVFMRPQWRKHVLRFRAPAAHIPLTGAFVESSVVESLRRLHTDYLDVFALHEPTIADVQRDDVLRALENVIQKGYARTISFAGDPAVGLAVSASSERVRIIQLANNLFAPNLVWIKKELAVNRSFSFVSHGAYGYRDSLHTLERTFARNARKRRLMDSAGYPGDSRKAAAAFLLDFALATNAEGVVLLSMFHREHLTFNIDRLTKSPPPEVVLQLARQLVSQKLFPSLASREEMRDS